MDFAAVTDHAEWLADVALCTDEDSAVYKSAFCKGFRQESRWDQLRYFYEARFRSGRSPEVCGPDGKRCRDATLSAWHEVQQAAEDFYDRGKACQFTTFHGYEYSRREGFFTMHRNVIFRNERVPELPTSWVEADLVEDLWRTLARDCNDAPGHCEVLTIPHNTNFSSGMAFRLPYRDADPANRQRYAESRARFEPLVEIMQAKGESECRSGLPGVVGAPDEFCDFEKIMPAGESEAELCGGPEGQIPLSRCLGPLGYARYGLAEGLAEKAVVGSNPLAYGFIGSTDTHSGTPGAVAEANYGGHTGNRASTPTRRLLQKGAGGTSIRANPGGLAGVWAEENSRDALFDAMLRRETFATSGPRIQPRFFAADEFPADICGEADSVELAYERGVPMGGELNPSTPPEFLLQALRDTEGNDLQRIQIVKVWHEGANQYGQKVYDVASVSHDEPVLDVESCEVLVRGADEFCQTWQDPEFDASEDAAYYMRVLEMPACRWSRLQCLGLPEDERPENCDDPDIPRVIQERAWTSPIWVGPL